MKEKDTETIPSAQSEYIRELFKGGAFPPALFYDDIKPVPFFPATLPGYPLPSNETKANK